MKAKAPQHNLKHGLYAKRIAKDEQAVLDAVPVGNLEGEIAYLRAVTSRLALILEKNGLAAGSTKQLSSETRKTLGELDRAMSRLLKYVRQHVLLSGEASDYEALVEAGKDAAREARGVLEYFEASPPAPLHLSTNREGRNEADDE